MNKARKKAHKQGSMKRLVRESLILSSTRFLSSRVVRFFETGIASPLIKSVGIVDNFIREKVSGPLFEKIELRKKFIIPMRNRFASFISRNPVMVKISAIRSALLNASLRSLGIFLLTFGVYAAVVFFLKRFISEALGTADTDDLSVAAMSVIVGMLLTMFGDKSIISSFGNGRITGSLLSSCLGVNDSFLDRTSSSPPTVLVGISFLLGSLLGISTMFFSPVTVLLSFAALVVAVIIMHIPEFGLLLSVSTVSFLPVWICAAFAFVTLVSYLLKWLRLKRNLRFGSADAAVLLLLVVLYISSCISGNVISDGEHYMLVFLAMYFVAKNIICSEKLIYQTFNALSLGASIGMILFLIGEFAAFIPHIHFRIFADIITRYTLNEEMLAMLVSSVLPFAFSSYSFGNKNREVFIFVLTVACAVVTDSFLFYVLAIISLFAFVAIVYKAPVGAAFSAAIILPPAVTLIGDFTASSVIAAFSQSSYNIAISDAGELGFRNFWEGLSGVGGIVSIGIFVIALVLILQRVFSGVILNSSSRVILICGTVSASAVMMLVCLCIFNPFSDLRILFLMWFIFGLCGSAYKVGSQNQYNVKEV